MNIRQNFSLAWRNLLANKLRFVQALLGMVIGVAAVVAILGVQQGMVNQIDAVYGQLSSSLMRMGTYRPINSSENFTVDDMEQLVAAHPEFYLGMTPIVTVPGGVKYGDQVFEQVSVLGVNDFMLEVAPVLQVAEGRFLQPMDIAREQNVCVIGANVADEVLGGEALNKTIRIQGNNYLVVGVMARIADDYNGFNDETYIPYTNADKMVEERIIHTVDDKDYYFREYYVNANGMDNIANARITVHDAVKALYGEDIWLYSASFRYYKTGDLTSVYDLTKKLLLAAGVVLLVGGVGIMNVMLAAVTERRPEIGVRKAYGATNGDIRRQFWMEAACTSLIGGVIGVVLGLAGSVAACQVMQLPLRMMGLPVAPILAAFAVAALIGVLFGVIPAGRAAKLQIVEAMRIE